MAPDRTSPSSGRTLRTVALVGIDGSGKTTQARRLAVELSAAGYPAAYHQNAGGRRWFGQLAARFGQADAEDLLGRRLMLVVESVLRWLAIARALLRRRSTGDIAIMDRYAVCQYASIRARGHRAARGEWLARLAYRLLPAPDVTFLLSIRPIVAWQRVEDRGYDHETIEYLAAADAAYRSLPEYASVVVIDANRTPDQVNADILGHLAGHLPGAPAVAEVQATPVVLPRPRPAITTTAA
jgi:dTMP kinase